MTKSFAPWSSLLLAATVACGGAAAGPPRGEDYTPVNTPERETSCKTEWTEAKTAREQMVGTQSVEMREKTAAAVYAHAACEHAIFEEQSLDAETQDEVFEKIRVARELYFAARNLYQEVITYGSAAYVHAGGRLGDLHIDYARKLRDIAPPAELGNPTERELFQSELAELAQTFEAEAATAYSDALLLAESAITVDPNGADIQWTGPACAMLERLDPTLASERVLCQR